MTNSEGRKVLRMVRITQEISSTDKLGWFHGWFHNQQDIMCALVEMADGKVSMYQFLQYHIEFVDESELSETPKMS